MDKSRAKKLRVLFRDGVFKRDGHRCVFCVLPAVDAHHITDRHDMPNDGYAVENGVSVCAHHHFLAEVYHISSGLYWVKGYHPNDIYSAIGTTYDDARDASEKL